MKLNLADFPAYSFSPDGVVSRVVPVSRGLKAGFTGPMSTYVRKSDGRRFYQLTKAGGAVTTVTVDAVRAYFGNDDEPRDFTPPERVLPRLIPEDNIFGRAQLPHPFGFNDYLADERGFVWRYRSFGKGDFPKLRQLKTTPYRKLGTIPRDYYRLQHDRGYYKCFTPPQIVAMLGVTPAQHRAALQLAQSINAIR